MFPWVKLAVCRCIGSDYGLAPNRRQAIIWANVGIAYCRKYRPIYASLGPRSRRLTLAINTNSDLLASSLSADVWSRGHWTYSLQWRHMSDMASQITGNSTGYSAACSG